MEAWGSPEYTIRVEIQDLEREADNLRDLLDSDACQAIDDMEYTPARALAEGMNPPDYAPETCAHCGAVRDQRGTIVSCLGLVMWIGHYECYCDGAVGERRERLERVTAEHKRLTGQYNRIIAERRIKASGLGARFMNRTFEQFTIDDSNRDAYDAARRYVKDFAKYRDSGDGLYFSGGYGVGKTHLAAAIALELMYSGVGVVYSTGVDLLAAIRATYDGDGESEGDVLDEYRNAPLLVIDDLGKENPTAWAQSMIYDIINARYECQRPIVITTNYDDEALARRLRGKDGDMTTAEAIVSRLHEMTFAVPMYGRDRRTAG